MIKPKIIADCNIPFLKGIFEPFADITYIEGNKICQIDIQNADALLVRTRTKCNAELLENTNIKFIASATIGYDHIDTDYCTKNNIVWTNAPGCNAASVEQYVVSALLELAKEYNFELKDKVLGIIGVGYVGSKVARIANTLGMNVLLNDPPRERKEGRGEFVDLNELQKKADIISFHVPLNFEGEDKTFEMADDEFFKKLKKGAILINTSRGEIIEEIALEKAIDQKILSATVLDVWRNEPLIKNELLKKVTIATPHIAGYSADGKAKGTEMCVNASAEMFKLDIAKPFEIILPELNENQIYIDKFSGSSQDIIYQVYAKTYNILVDDRNLKEQPEQFETLRENYSLRREPKAFYINYKAECNIKLLSVLKQLGFRIK